MEIAEKEVKEMSLKEMRDLVLEDKVVKIKPIIRRKPYLKRGHDGEHTYTGCYKSHGLPFDVKTRSYKNPFKNSAEQAIFEKLLNKKEGSLNLYEYKIDEPNFWGEFLTRIPKEGMELNLNNPTDALRYRIFLINPKFAQDNSQSHTAEKEYVIINEAQEREQISQLSRKKSKATDYLYKIKKSKKEMIDVLKLLGKNPDKESQKEWLEAELYKVIDEVSVNRGTSGLDKFLAVMEDPLAEPKLFVLNAIEAKEIIRIPNGYKIADTNKFVGRKYEEVVDYFLSKDPEVQQDKLIIQERIK